MTDQEINALVAQHIYSDALQKDDRGWYIPDYCNDDIFWCAWNKPA